jgi:hypothetical protein
MSTKPSRCQKCRTETGVLTLVHDQWLCMSCIANWPEQLDALLELAHKHAENVMLGTTRELMPIFALVNSTGGLDLIGCPWADEEEKAIMVAKVKRQIRASAAVAYSFVTEAWMATQDHEYEPGRDLRPTQRADRQEVVIACATDGKDTRWGRWAIERNAKGECVALRPLVITEARLTSWLADLFTK